MRCRQCGAESSCGIFCTFCGARLSGENSAVQDHERQELLALLSRVCTVAEKCAPYFDNYNQLEREIEICYYRRYENKTWKKIFYIGLPFAILLALPVLLFLGSFELTGGIKGYLTVALPVAALIAGWIIACIMVKNNGESINRQMFEDDQRRIEEACEQQDRIEKEIRSIYSKSGLAQSYPIEYLNIDTVKEIYSYVSSMRADTLKEAINLYEETHRQFAHIDARF